MSKLMLKHEDLWFSLQVFQWKIGDTFYIEKWSANEHTYLGFTRLLGHLERKWEQFCNLGSVSDHGFSFMDKQLLLTAVRFTQCRLVPYIANTVLYWQHFSRLVSAVPGCSVEHGFTYLDLHWIQLFRIIRNFLKLLKTHQSQPLLEVWIFAITQWLYLSC